MSLGMKITILIGVGIVAVVLLFVFLFRPLIPALRGSKAPVAPTGQVTSPQPVVESPSVPPNAPRALSESEKRSASLRAAATFFAERYGTYSRAGNYENITDLFPVMTDRQRAASEQFIRDARARENREDVKISGVTTRALDVALGSNSELSGAATVTVQRTETSVSGAERVYYQKLALSFVSVGGVWKADGAAWQELR